VNISSLHSLYQSSHIGLHIPVMFPSPLSSSYTSPSQYEQNTFAVISLHLGENSV
jgi:hypothetical protein